MKNKVLLLAAFICLVLAGCGQKSLDLNDYLKTEMSGYNGSGHVLCDVDFENLEKDYAAASGIKRDSDEYLIMQANLEMYIEANCDSDSLSNGDKYTVKWTIPANLAENKKVILKHEPKVLTASGLEEKPTFLRSVDDVTVNDIPAIRTATDEMAKEFLKLFDLLANEHSYYDLPRILDIHEDEGPEYAFAVAQKNDVDTITVFVYYKYTITLADESYTYGIPVGEHWEGFSLVTDWEEIPNEYNLYLPIEFRNVAKDSKGNVVVDSGTASYDMYGYNKSEYFCWKKGTDPNDEYASASTPVYYGGSLDGVFGITIDDIKAKALEVEGSKLIE